MPILDETNQQKCQEYDQFIHEARYTSITQQRAWSQVKANWTSFYVYLEEKTQIVAAMSVLLLEAESGQTFAYVTKGPVMNQPNVGYLERLIAEAEAELTARNVFLLRMDPEFVYSEELNEALKATGLTIRNKCLTGKATIQPRFNMLVDLKGKTEAEVLAERYGKTRYRIRYGGKHGVSVRRSSALEDLATFYRLYETTSQRHGISYRPFAYFQRLAEAFLTSGEMVILLAEVEGKPDAGGLCFVSGKKVWYMYAGSTHENQVLMAPYLVNWEGIRWAIEKNCDYYDLGGVFQLSNDDGLYQFKHGFIRPNTPIEYIGEIDKIYNQEAYQAFLSRG